MAVILIATIGVAALVSIDVGYVFYGQRQLQKVVDLAAVSGAQQLKRADDVPALNANVLATVRGTAGQNGYAAGVTAGCADTAASGADGMTACLGLWDPGNAANGDSKRHFNAGYDPARVSPNAVRVQATMTLPILFVFPGTSGRQLRAEAIAAASPPVASFSVGSGLLRVDTASGLLGRLLGPNISVNLSIADWSGLVGTNITLEQLRLAAGAGTIDQLLGLEMSLRDFYALVLKAGNKNALLGAAIGSPPTTLGIGGIGTKVSLAKLLDLGVLAPAASSAAEVGLNVASLLMLGAQLANFNAGAATMGSLNVGVARADVSLYVTQPPQTAVGPVRKTSGGWQTTAHTAQLGVKLAANVNVLGLQVNLPLYIEAAAATASLTQMQCAAAPADRRATINVQPQVANVCLASDSGPGCATAPVVLVDLAGLTKIVSNPVKQAVDLDPANDVVLAPGGDKSVSANKPLTTAVTKLLNNLNPSLVLGPLQLPPLIDLGALVGALLAPVTGLLDALLNNLLKPLGIDLGTANVWMQGIDCNNAELVY